MAVNKYEGTSGESYKKKVGGGYPPTFSYKEEN